MPPYISTSIIQKSYNNERLKKKYIKNNNKLSKNKKRKISECMDNFSFLIYNEITFQNILKICKEK
jgi:hypothetical protein